MQTRAIRFPEHERVCPFEDTRELHANGREIVHVEEASIVDLLDGYAPRRQPIALAREHAVERIEARRQLSESVELEQCFVDTA